uniref:Uncharacterized protein n=1 Tax=Ditylenchus dipsaci TaxID=166011 RepID=A0A915DAX0_9BILA
MVSVTKIAHAFLHKQSLDDQPASEITTLKLDNSSPRVSHHVPIVPDSQLHIKALRPTGGDACFGQNQGVFLKYGDEENCRFHLKWSLPNQLELETTDKNSAKAIYKLVNNNQDGVDIFLKDNFASFSSTSKDLNTNCVFNKNKHPKDTSGIGTTKLEFAQANSNLFNKECALLYEMDTSKSAALTKKDDGTRSLFGWKTTVFVFFLIVLGMPCLCVVCVGALVGLVLKNVCCE